MNNSGILILLATYFCTGLYLLGLSWFLGKAFGEKLPFIESVKLLFLWPFYFFHAVFVLARILWKMARGEDPSDIFESL